MNELTEVRSLILGRRPAKHGVAMGMATEAGDDVAMAARLGCRKRIDLPQILWRLVDQRLAKQNATFEEHDLLRVSEGEQEEGLLPHGCQLRVVSPLEAIDREAERLAVCANACEVSR